MELDKLAATLHPLERAVLPVLKKFSDFDSVVKHSNLSEVEVMRALQWLENKGLVSVKVDLKEIIHLEENGMQYFQHGLPERRFLRILHKNSLSLKDIEEKAKLSKEELNISIGILRQQQAISFDKNIVSLTENGRKFMDKETLEESLIKRLFDNPVSIKDLSKEERFAFDNLRKRKSIVSCDIKKMRTIRLTETGKKIIEIKPGSGVLERLTPEVLRSNSWKDKQFRHYDVSINVPKVYGARRHFVNQAVDYIRRIWLELGFTEMKGTLIQTSFWDLDALFVPQDHPARDMQDTFYIKDPRFGRLPQELAKRVKEVHENGGDTGSLGWRNKWSSEIARENLLRTHTTVLSAQTIAKLKTSDLPAKFFSVKKVFRNETLSWKHLFELNQVEGIVVDPDANFNHLLGYLKRFFAKMGFDDVRIRPGHFPYTEPSAEVDVWHPEKKKWVELGGSGVFRPEVTKTLIGTEVPVLAWGLGMERSIMEYYQIKDIRELYRNDLKQLREMKLWLM